MKDGNGWRWVIFLILFGTPAVKAASELISYGEAVDFILQAREYVPDAAVSTLCAFSGC